MRARTATILGSLALHALLGGAALFYARDARTRKAHSIAIASDHKKKKEAPPKPPKAAPPPPRPKLASATIPALPPAPAPPREAPARRSAPAAGTMSNVGGGEAGGSGTGGDGTGVGAGGGGGGPATSAPKRTAQVAEPVGEAPCTEQPTKATPVSRPTEIEYTQQARADGIEGRLVLKVIVDADGAVREVIVVSSVDPALDAAAIAAVKTWVFKPAMRCGKPMAGGTYVLAQRFELGD